MIDAIRNAVSLGGDTDTTACIAGGIAEGFYGRTKAMESACENLLPEAMREVLYAFEAVREVGVEEIEKKTSQ